MKVPISNRLLLCAALVPPGSRVADIGTDHGYLAVHLLREGVCPFVTAADLREQPLQKARENAARFGVADRMQFLLSDGLQSIPPDAAGTIVMAGMGGDLMVRILEAAPWVCDARYTLILQPQSAGQALRQYLAGHGFLIEREALAQDGHFLYTVLRAKKGTMPPAHAGAAIRHAAAACRGRAAAGRVPCPHRGCPCRHCPRPAEGQRARKAPLLPDRACGNPGNEETP